MISTKPQGVRTVVRGGETHHRYLVVDRGDPRVKDRWISSCLLKGMSKFVMEEAGSDNNGFLHGVLENCLRDMIQT